MLPRLIVLPLLLALILNDRTDWIKDMGRYDYPGNPFAAQGHGLLEVTLFNAPADDIEVCEVFLSGEIHIPF